MIAEKEYAIPPYDLLQVKGEWFWWSVAPGTYPVGPFKTGAEALEAAEKEANHGV
jgi:hypothetical protein